MFAHLHLHTTASLNDGNITAAQCYAAAKEKGVAAVATTDHGNLMAVEEFYSVFEKNNKSSEDGKIKYIPGVEVYFEGALNRREHLVLLAKDAIGYKAICKAVTESNDHLDKRSIPLMTWDNLERHFGAGTDGHGHVIALSACMQGIICVELLYNEFLEKEAQKEEKKAQKYAFDRNEYKIQKDLLDKKTAELTACQERRKELSALKNKTFAKKQKDVEKLFGTDAYDSAKETLEKEIAETEMAKTSYADIKAQETALSKECTNLRKTVKWFEDRAEQFNELMAAGNEIRSQGKTSMEMYFCAREKARKFNELFGGEFYIEIQYHGIDAEKTAFPQCVDIAEDLGIEIVATNDAHIVTGSSEDRKRRQILRSLRYNQWEEENIGDDELYIKTEAELYDALCRIIDRNTVKKAIANTMVIADKCNVVLPKENHYPRWNGEYSADDELWNLVNAGKETRFPNGDGWSQVYEDRLAYEMEIIKKLDVVDYLVIVADFLRYGALLGKVDLSSDAFLDDPFNFENLEKLAEGNVGLGVGFGRGSAVGSLVCYLAGITGADPIKYNLLFERFLNPERVSMPDIDSDFSPEIRGWVLEYVKHKYGRDAVCCIMTTQQQAAKAAIRNCARLLGDKKAKDSSVFLKLGGDICNKIPDELGIILSECKDDLFAAFKDNPDAVEIINDALLVEGTITATGTHAAGVIIADNGDVGEYIPLMYSKDGEKTTQCTKDFCENRGLLKMDFLGLRNLSIISETERSIKENYGVLVDTHTIPLNDPKVFKEIFAKGKTDSVFQFESAGMKNLLTKFKPETIEHLTMLNALFRPGPLQYADDICNARNNRGEPVRYLVPAMKTILGNTYGKPIYQEQIQQLFHEIAGFSLGKADIIRRAMSKKHVDEFTAYYDEFIDGLVKAGADRKEADDFWQEIVKFSEYCFNKSHAAAYAITAYYTAYLKYYYPKEYLCAIMNDIEFEKLGSVFADAASYKIKVLPPDINTSFDRFCPNKDNTISYGLSTIKQVASAAKDIIGERNENGAFISYEDFRERTSCPKGALVSLIKAGAMDCFCNSGNVIAWRRQKLEEAGVKDVPNTDGEIVSYEKEVVGAFLLQNPVKGYVSKDKISQFAPGACVQCVGVITKLRKTKTKTGQPMAMFELEDDTGTISAVCFPSSYESAEKFLSDGAIVALTGKVKTDSRSEEGRLQLVVESAETPCSSVRSIIITSSETPIRTILDYIEKTGYYDKKGIDLYWDVQGDVRLLKHKVKVDILKDENIGHLLSTN